MKKQIVIAIIIALLPIVMVLLFGMISDVLYAEAQRIYNGIYEVLWEIFSNLMLGVYFTFLLIWIIKSQITLKIRIIILSIVCFGLSISMIAIFLGNLFELRTLYSEWSIFIVGAYFSMICYLLALKKRSNTG